MKKSLQLGTRRTLVAPALVISGFLLLAGRATATIAPGLLLHTAPPPTKDQSDHKKFHAVQVGLASWYGPNFHGRKTASGDLFNQEALTAAHPLLPLGSRVKVTKVDTAESVEVEINDRGPFVNGRIIDLSRAAARVLNMLEKGTTKVRVEVLFTPDNSVPLQSQNTN